MLIPGEFGIFGDLRRKWTITNQRSAPPDPRLLSRLMQASKLSEAGSPSGLPAWCLDTLGDRKTRQGRFRVGAKSKERRAIQIRGELRSLNITSFVRIRILKHSFKAAGE
jgi:hypothetical protein